MSGSNAIVNWLKKDDYEKDIIIIMLRVQDLDMRHLTTDCFYTVILNWEYFMWLFLGLPMASNTWIIKVYDH